MPSRPWNEIRSKIVCKKCGGEGKFWDHTEERKVYRMCKLCGHKELIVDMNDFGNLPFPWYGP